MAILMWKGSVLTMDNRFRPAGEGFNGEWAIVQGLRDGTGNLLGYTLNTECGTNKKYLDKYFMDSHAAAIAALNAHRCPTPEMTDEDA